MRLGERFYRHAKLIAIAARSGGDPETNPALRLAIENSKRKYAKMPILIVRLKRNRRRQRWSTDDGDSLRRIRSQRSSDSRRSVNR